MSAVAAPLHPPPRRASARTTVVAPAAIAAAVFLALAAFATLIYGQLLLHTPALRLLASAVIATTGSATLALRRRDGRPLLVLAARPPALAATLLLALLALGIPAHLFLPAHWGTLGERVGGGVDALGAWLWPYRGIGRWARLDVMALAPVVIVAAGGLCFWPGAGPRRRGAALALLLGLFLTGAANTSQAEPGLRGLILLFLLAAWVWAPAAAPASAARAARWLLLPALLALALRPAFSSTEGWVGFREAAGTSASGVSFRWDQTYGPIDWPRTDATVFTVAAAHPGLLRVTSLDRFDGRRFVRSSSPPYTLGLEQRMALDRRFLTHTRVRIAGLSSSLLVSGDGLAQRLLWLGGPRPAVTVEGDGTLAASAVARDSLYSVVAYRPRPSPARLRRAPRAFPRAYIPYASFELPSGLSTPPSGREASAPVPVDYTIVPSAPGRSPAQDPASAARIEASPYGSMFTLARGLAAGARSSYETALNIQHFLLANYTYDEHPPRSRYPLEAFLFQQRRGYCQQFSGAMTLMLRMDGIPARVGSGFKPDLYNPRSGTWNIRALDAHSWVEVFFSGIGWVTFDPTPAAPVAAVSGASSAAANKSEIAGGGSASLSSAATRVHRVGGGSPTSGSGESGLMLAAAAMLAALAAGLGALWLRGHLRLRAALRGGEGAVDELRAALQRSGRGAGALTLDRLERSMRERGEEAAAGYLAALRDGRYTLTTARGTRHGRAALRRALRRGRGRRVALSLLSCMPPGAMRRGLLATGRKS